MTVQLKIPTHTLALLGVLAERVIKTKANSRREKVVLSIAQQLADKLLAKAYKAMRVSDFNKNKPQSVSLKLYEADVLEYLLKTEIDATADTFIINAFTRLSNDINQKLA
ncbi:hypothetical protein [Flavobacterium sp.]|uniref:hypothetical protein n=1 Tax=Flavobacterium sp. TaxID=239 RepID=UPI0037530869